MISNQVLKANIENPSSEEVNSILSVTIGIMFIFYAVLIFAIVHNVAKYLVAQRRYKSLHIAYFYILAVLIIILRLVWFTMIFLVTIGRSG